METALRQLFKIFSNREKRSEVTAGRESEVEYFFSCKMDNDQVEKKKWKTAMRNKICRVMSRRNRASMKS